MGAGGRSLAARAGGGSRTKAPAVNRNVPIRTRGFPHPSREGQKHKANNMAKGPNPYNKHSPNQGIE